MQRRFSNPLVLAVLALPFSRRAFALLEVSPGFQKSSFCFARDWLGEGGVEQRHIRKAAVATQGKSSEDCTRKSISPHPPGVTTDDNVNTEFDSLGHGHHFLSLQQTFRSMNNTCALSGTNRRLNLDHTRIIDSPAWTRSVASCGCTPQSFVPAEADATTYTYTSHLARAWGQLATRAAIMQSVPAEDA